MEFDVQWSTLGKEAKNASRPFDFKRFPQVVFINTGDVLGGRFLHEDLSDAATLPGQAKKAIRPHDILLSEIRPGNSRFIYIEGDVESHVVSTKFLVIETLGRVRSKFLYYCLTNKFALQEFQRIAEGRSATFPQITFNSIAHFPIPVPSNRQQELFIQFFDQIEERLSLLSKTNNTLQAVAQALFKSWFVDYDPVRAKAEGREPEGMDAATAALFPASFSESPMGLVPLGWRPLRLGEVATLSKGTVKPQTMPSTQFQHFSLPAFDALRLPSTELGEAIKSNKTPVPSGAVLVSKLNPHIPRIWYVGDVVENSVCSTEFLVWTPKAGAGSAFVYCLAASQVFNSAMRQLVTGTSNSHQRVKPDQLADVEVIAASDAALSAFEAIAAPLLAKVHHNRTRAATLTQVRDTLLPRLVSGKLRLPDAEREIEAATA